MKYKRLWLLAVIITALLAGCAAGSDSSAAQITGREWTLVQINGSAAITSAKVTLTLEDGQASGSSGCNSYGGQYTVSGDKLSFKQTVQTMMACVDNDIMAQESAYGKALAQVTSYQVSNGQLELKNSAGEVVLVFQ